MSSRELRSLVSIADHGSITAASEALFLTVPAVSAHVANLEREFGVQLLDRKRKPARLSEAGLVIVERAREILRLHDQLHNAVADSSNFSGVLRIGASPTVLTSIIPRSLAALRKAYPRLQVRMRYGRPAFLIKRLEHDEIDVAFISEPRTQLEGVKWTMCALEPIVVIAPPHARGHTDEALLREFPYIRFGSNFLVSRDIEEHLAARQLELKDAMDVESVDAIKLLVLNGLGVSIVPDGNPRLSQLYGLRVMPLGTPPLMRRIGIAEAVGGSKPQIAAELLDIFRRTSLHDVHPEPV